MECMQAKALRPSLRGELLTQPDLVQEVYYNTTTHTAVSCISGEDSLVDEFLDLQNVEFEEKNEQERGQEEEGKHSLSFDDEYSNLSSGLSDSSLASELAVPDDDIAGLEWVSHFVDDSLSEFSLFHPVNKQRTEARPANRFKPEPNRPVPAVAPSFPTVPVKPRTKRSRPATRPSSLSPLSESSSTSSSSSSSSSSPSFGFPAGFVFASPVGGAKSDGEPERKKQKRKPPVQAGPLPAGAMFQRRCSHCQVQKTPQWRTGPLGAKTLCNACGVRFKSGRLFPEYRPACSPTFSSEVHSNSHRKVLEMRKKKELVGPGSGSGSGLGLTHFISSF